MKKYNWCEDPKNRNEVKQISWWNHDENKTTFKFPISVIQSDKLWIATCNKETKKLLGDRLYGCAQGKTKNEAIKEMFTMIKIAHYYSEDCQFNYQRFVPFRKGNWKHTGGKWFVIFGIHIYFRFGKGMKGGWYFPLTKLNVSISSDWTTYRKWKQNEK